MAALEYKILSDSLVPNKALPRLFLYCKGRMESQFVQVHGLQKLTQQA